MTASDMQESRFTNLLKYSCKLLSDD